MKTPLSLYDRLFYWWKFKVADRPLWCYLKRPWCWITDHAWHELASGAYVLTPHYKDSATHMCERCLKFKEDPNASGT